MEDQGEYSCPAHLTCGNLEDYPGIDFKTECVYDKAYLNYGVTNF
jgi:hypothetical protein